MMRTCHFFYTETKLFFFFVLPLLFSFFISNLLTSQEMNEPLLPDDFIIEQTLMSDVVEDSDHIDNTTAAIENLTVEPRATTAVLSWEPLQNAEPGVVQGYTISRRTEGDMYEAPVAYTGTDTFYIDSRLEMGTTYYYMITARIDHEESGQSDEVRITTLPTQDNLYTYANLKTAVLIYINTNAGEIPDDQIQRIKNAIEVARSFIWRNSLMKLNLQVTYYVIGDHKIFGDGGDYWGSVQKTAEHLRELGVMNTQYDIVYRVSPATGGYWSYGVLNLDLPGPVRQTGFSHSVWPTRSGVRYHGHDADTHYDLSWVFLHEVQHAIDAVYNANGLPQKHHGDRPHLFPYPAGEHYDFQAKMFRVFDKYEELLSNWGGIYEAWDTGNYGFPDAEPLVPMDEVRFGSNPHLRDTDGDGLADRDEFLDGIYSGSDPHNPDSNKSGIPDGNDPYPRYRVNTYIPERTSTINGLKVVTQIVSIDSVIYTQIGYSPKVYMTYDEDSLYLEIRLPEHCSHIEFQFDFESDGWWYGRGNTSMRINPHTGSITELLSQDASPEGRAFSQSIGGWAGGIWDDHPQYEPHFGRRVFEKEWIGLNVRTENPPEIIVALAIPKNEYAGLYLIPGDTFGINIYYYNVHDDPGQWASTFDVYSFVNFVFHDYDITQFAGGSGTENDPYLIETPEHLHTVRSFHWAHFLQIADIDLGVSPWNTDKGWLPIGDDYKKFTGSYDGNGFTISNLTIRRPDENWAGLFGYAHGAKLKNIGIKEADIRGGSFTGGLAGKIEQGIISNSYIEGRVSGNWCVGGLVGETADRSTVDSSYADVTVVCNNRSGGGLVGSHVNNSIINNSYAKGNVSGGGSLGGLVGDHHNSSTHNSFAGGNISGGDILGGLIGNHAGGSKITNSYATGSVEGSREIGGLVGWNQSGSTITNSYSTGNVRGTESEESAGGLVGVQDGGSTAMHSYWNTNTSGKISSAGGEGRTTDEMSYPYAVNTYVNWDFIGIWKADTEYSMNNGYPYHRWKPVVIQPMYTLTLVANPQDGGTVSGGGSYEEGDTVTVSAVPSGDYVFVNWTIGDAVVMDGLDTAGVTFRYVMPPYDVLIAGNFNVAIADIPALLSPQNDEIHISVDTSLVWKESKRAVTYHVQVSVDSDFVTCLIDSIGITGTSLEVRDLGSLTRYYWRVCALNESGSSGWSEVWSFTTYDVTSVARYHGNIPTEYILYQNYPNPFNPSTIIRYGLPERCRVQLAIYNALGQIVLRPVDEELEAGYYEVIFDASHLPSGIYMYRLQSGEFVHSKKMLYLK